jgi:hypothetical protein
MKLSYRLMRVLLRYIEKAAHPIIDDKVGPTNVSARFRHYFFLTLYSLKNILWQREYIKDQS